MRLFILIEIPHIKKEQKCLSSILYKCSCHFCLIKVKNFMSNKIKHQEQIKFIDFHNIKFKLQAWNYDSQFVLNQLSPEIENRAKNEITVKPQGYILLRDGKCLKAYWKSLEVDAGFMHSVLAGLNADCSSARQIALPQAKQTNCASSFMLLYFACNGKK